MSGMMRTFIGWLFSSWSQLVMLVQMRLKFLSPKWDALARKGRTESALGDFESRHRGIKAFLFAGFLCHHPAMQMSPQKKDFFTLLPCSGKFPPWLFMTANCFGYMPFSWVLWSGEKFPDMGKGRNKPSAYKLSQSTVFTAFQLDN